MHSGLATCQKGEHAEALHSAASKKTNKTTAQSAIAIKKQGCTADCTIGTADQLGQGLAIEKQSCTAELRKSARPINRVKDSQSNSRAARQSCTIGTANHWVKDIPGRTRECVHKYAAWESNEPSRRAQGQLQHTSREGRAWCRLPNIRKITGTAKSAAGIEQIISTARVKLCARKTNMTSKINRAADSTSRVDANSAIGAGTDIRLEALDVVGAMRTQKFSMRTQKLSKITLRR